MCEYRVLICTGLPPLMHPPSLQFTFASNAATIVGGCLVTNTYKLRLPAAFISAFIISVSFILSQTAACPTLWYSYSSPS